MQQNNMTKVIDIEEVKSNQDFSPMPSFPPRDLEEFAHKIENIIYIEREFASDYIYAIPLGDKISTGPSIRFAELLYAHYKNCRLEASSIVINPFEKYAEAEATFIDLETNTKTTEIFRKPLCDSRGKLFPPFMQNTIGQVASSAAKRNVILRAIPRYTWRVSFDLIKKYQQSGGKKTLKNRMNDALNIFKDLGITQDQVLENLKIQSLDDFTSEHLTVLTSIYKAVKNGEEQLDSYFPKKNVSSNSKAKTLESIVANNEET